MTKYWGIFTFFCCMLLLIGCGDYGEKNEAGPIKKQLWKTQNYIDSLQIVFTNEYAFKDGRGTKGAASFLVTSKSGPLLCTAKHLLDEAMSISPKVDTRDFNQELDFWNAYSRQDSLYNDTLNITGIVNKAPSLDDILLLKFSGNDSNVVILPPRFTKIQPNEVLEVIGYEFGKAQIQRFEVQLDEYNNRSFMVKAKQMFKPAGMSGSPVIDANGYVVGVLVGGGAFEGELYLTVEPLTRVKKYLN